MGFKIYTQLYCDRCQKMGDSREGHQASNIRYDLKMNDDWVHTKTEDICPDCQIRGKEDQ